MPFLSIDRILPLGRMLALPPPFSATVFPGGVRPALWLTVPGFPEVPGFAAGPLFPVAAVVVDLPAVVPGFPALPGRPVVEVLAAVPVLVEVVPGLVIPGFWPAVAVWPAVFGRLVAAVCAGADVCAGAEA
jgi:hypothetical protein